MGLVITKYEDSANQNIRFDYSKFDYMYDSDSFPTDAATDVENILLEHGDMYTIIRQTTTEDSMGHVITVSETTFAAYGMFQDITKKDRKIHEMGLAVPGNRKFYMKPTYSTTSAGVETTNEIKEGDIIQDGKQYSGINNGQWRIVKIITEPHLPEQDVYKVAIVQNINLDGTA